MRRILCLIVSLATCELAHADNRYEFPPGVPYKASEVEWYTPTDAYQFDGSMHSRRYNISAAKPAEPFGNANLEFPWKTGGLDLSRNATTSKFRKYPAGSQVTVWMDRGSTKSMSHGPTNWMIDIHRAWRGKYPEGMLFGEVIKTDGRTTEVRSMVKRGGKWDFHVYRPFSSYNEVESYLSSSEWFSRTLENKHPFRVVSVKSLDVNIEMNQIWVDKILSQRFRDVIDVPFFTSSSGQKCYCPSTTKPHQIVPINYQGWALSKQTCVQCHQTVGKSTEELQPGRDWYGFVRGIDGVYSNDNIVDKRCISDNGFGRKVIFNQTEIAAGRLKVEER